MIRFGSPLRIAAAAVLGAACLGLTLVISLELTGRSDALDVLPGRTTPPPAAPSREPSRFTMPPLQSFAAITARPLFSRSRRPAPVSSESLGPWSSLVLAGIIITPDAREALIRHGNPNVTSHVKIGQQVQGWTVVAILPDGVVLRSGATEHKLKLPQKAEGGAVPGAYSSPRRR